MPSLQTPIEIERVHAPSRAQFEEQLLRRGRPALITGVVDQWPAFRSWSSAHLEAVAGARMVRPDYDAEGRHERYFVPGSGRRSSMSLGALLRGLAAEPPDTRHFLVEQPLGALSPRLIDDLNLDCYGANLKPSLFLGRATFSPLHYHAPDHAILCQIFGDKTVILYRPGSLGSLYAYPWYCALLNFSRVDDRRPDFARYPKFRGVVGVRVEVKAGEMLFLPVHWWHSVEGPGLACTVTLFWRARLRQRRFPSPAPQVLAHRFAAPVSVRAAARRLGRRVARTRGKL